MQFPRLLRDYAFACPSILAFVTEGRPETAEIPVADVQHSISNFKGYENHSGRSVIANHADHCLIVNFKGYRSHNGVFRTQTQLR
jgi:hypothetical protein